MKMFGLNRWSPVTDMFAFQRDVDRLFNQFWSDLPRTSGWSSSFQVQSSDDAWHIDIPMPGIDPQRVELEAAGATITVRVKPSGDQRADGRSEQTFTVPQFLDIERLAASHQHGMLRLTLPLKESVRPRRIEIATAASEPKQLTAAAA